MRIFTLSDIYPSIKNYVLTQTNDNENHICLHYGNLIHFPIKRVTLSISFRVTFARHFAMLCAVGIVDINSSLHTTSSCRYHTETTSGKSIHYYHSSTQSKVGVYDMVSRIYVVSLFMRLTNVVRCIYSEREHRFQTFRHKNMLHNSRMKINRNIVFVHFINGSL